MAKAPAALALLLALMLVGCTALAPPAPSSAAADDAASGASSATGSTGDSLSEDGSVTRLAPRPADPAAVRVDASGVGEPGLGEPSLGELAQRQSLVAAATAGGSRADERVGMVRYQLAARGIDDVGVLDAMARVPRHRFIPMRNRSAAYRDRVVPIGYGQTISQPYVVALMSELLDLSPGDRVLEIGTGSGYHAAVLSGLAAEVYSIEILKPLADRARNTLEDLGYDNVHVRMGDGYRGWPAAAPFDAILLTAAPPQIPQPLLDQLAPGGRLVAPVGEGVQELTRITRDAGGALERERIATVYFVPMTGRAEEAAPPAADRPEPPPQ